MARMAGTAARAEALLGLGVVSTTPVAGGDICTSTRLRLTDGHGAIIKTRPHAPEGFFEREADGLRWLREAGGAKVPAVMAVAPDCLVVDWVEPSKPTTDAAERFGRDLAATHAAGADAFGAPVDGFIGLAPLPNRSLPTWPEFFASRRVMPYLRAAVDRRALTTDEATVIESAMRRIHDLAGPAEPPARIHGDLWSGNLVWGSDGDVWLTAATARPTWRCCRCSAHRTCSASSTPTPRLLRSPTGGRTGARSTSCTRCWCTRCCSAAPTACVPPPRPSSCSRVVPPDRLIFQRGLRHPGQTVGHAHSCRRR
jgi:fructosamine-3-kinase